MASPARSAAAPSSAPSTASGLFAELYTFKWSEFSLRLPLVSAVAVAVCLFAGILAGHPGAGLIAGGGAFTVGFGANQRISDSRLIPMMAAVFSTSTAALAGTVAGHRDYWLLIAAAGSALLYGFMTARNSGVAWVGQQAFVAMIVSSAFPSGPEPALIRAGLIAAGGIVQVIFTSAGLRLMPDLRKDFVALAAGFYASLRDDDQVLGRLRRLHLDIPALQRHQAFSYSVRLMLAAVAATEVYRRLGMQSGYWIPMTALLVQRPSWREAFPRATARVLGTLAGAWLGSLFIAHVVPRPEVLAAIAAVFALLAFAANSVNYGLFTAFLTGYIVFLLSLNQIPGPEIAHRRAWCTALGAVIALAFHIDALRSLFKKREDSAGEQQERIA
jgi:hypothetical protein